MGAHRPVYLVIDIGAGHGAKIALFRGTENAVEETLLPVSAYGDSFDSFSDSLTACIEQKVSRTGLSQVEAIGISCAGILGEDGSFLLVSNMPFLNGRNLKKNLEQRFSVPVGIENDGNAGGLAEWSLLRTELLYWVLGGGWGGAWISSEGRIRFPSHGWDGRDSSLHYSNEPGYALPLEINALEQLFCEEGVSFEKLAELLLKEMSSEGEKLTGPAGSSEHLRAELIVSGPGRRRIFAVVAEEDDSYRSLLSDEEKMLLADPGRSGEVISRLSRLSADPAVKTDRIFGRVMALAARQLLNQARKGGLSDEAPICLSGQPSRALHYFGPAFRTDLDRWGHKNVIRPSVLLYRGFNPNLVGAAVLAERCAARAPS